MYGKHAVFSALGNSNRHIENIFCCEEIFNSNKKIITNYKFEIVTADNLTKILGQNHHHQGIAAKVRSIFLDDVNYIDLTNPNCKIAILDQITDPHNVGAIIRSAAAFNIDSIIMPADNSPEENATIAKTACGALETIKIIKVTNLKSTIEFLKKHGFWIIGLDSDAKEYVNSKLLTDKIALILGAEDTGMRRLTRESCDHLIKIPISNKVESLNVSNAAAIMFHLSNQYTARS